MTPPEVGQCTICTSLHGCLITHSLLHYHSSIQSIYVTGCIAPGPVLGDAGTEMTRSLNTLEIPILVGKKVQEHMDSSSMGGSGRGLSIVGGSMWMALAG